jgi:hypothetical protein
MSAANAIAALEGLAGREVRSAPFDMQNLHREVADSYGLQVVVGQPSWRGRRAAAPPAREAIFILRAPASCSAIIDSQGRCRPIVDGRIAVTAEERAALLQQPGWAQEAR